MEMEFLVQLTLEVLFAMMLVEHRATLMQSRSNLQQSGYKDTGHLHLEDSSDFGPPSLQALISADDPASAHAPWMLIMQTNLILARKDIESIATVHN